MRLGVDLGGTKIEIVALDEDGQEHLRRRRPTPRDDYDTTITTICDLVEEAESELAAKATVGIATPGALSPAGGLIKNSNSTCLNDRPFQTDIEGALGREVRIMNDANCFALSEAVDGAAAGAKVVFGVITGTGCGGGIVVDERTLIGINAISGEWGHNPMPWPDDGEWPGPPCYCGRSGCIETFLSGPGLAGDHLAHTGESLSPPEIAAGDDPTREATLARYSRRFAKAVASVINILDPDVVVWGGGLSNIDRFYRTIPALWGDYVFSDRVDTRLVRNRHGDSSGVRGAARLWPAN